MAEEVKVAPSVETPKEAVKVGTPTTVSVEEYETLKNKFAELEGTFKEKVNQASKAEREKFEKQLAKAKLSAEEQVKVEQEEKWNAIQGELNTLKIEKKQFLIKQHLTESGLPPFFTNDTRLVNAEATDIPSVVKSIKKEYEEYMKEMGKPAVSATAPKTQTTTPQGTQLIDNIVKNNPQLAKFLKK